MKLNVTHFLRDNYFFIFLFLNFFKLFLNFGFIQQREKYKEDFFLIKKLIIINFKRLKKIDFKGELDTFLW